MWKLDSFCRQSHSGWRRRRSPEGKNHDAGDEDEQNAEHSALKGRWAGCAQRPCARNATPRGSAITCGSLRRLVSCLCTFLSLTSALPSGACSA